MAAVLLDALEKVVTLSESQFELPEHVLADIARLATKIKSPKSSKEGECYPFFKTAPKIKVCIYSRPLTPKKYKQGPVNSL